MVLGIIHKGDPHVEAHNDERDAINHLTDNFGFTPPLPLRNISIANAGSDDKLPMDFQKGYWWAYDITSTRIWRSPDAVTWTQWAVCPAGQPQVILPTPFTGSNDAVVVTSQAIYQVPGFFAAANPSFGTAKVVANSVSGSSSNMTRFTCSSPAQARTPLDNGRKLIVSQYGAGTGFTASRYAYISLDGGSTWTQVFDSDSLTGNDPALSHVHGSEYCPYEDVFYVIEGHQAGGGIYVSTDNGVTWLKRYSMLDVEGRPTSSNPSQPTCIVSTDDGLVLTSDDAWAGLLGIPRIGPLASRKMALTWRWSTGRGSDVLGFGNSANRDPETGIVYAVYRSTFALQSPIVVGGTATVGSKIWEWPTPADVTDNNELRTFGLGPDNKIIIAGTIGATGKIVSGYLTGRGQAATVDLGNVLGGYAGTGTGVAAGPGASTNDTVRSAAFGTLSTSAVDGVAVGYKASNINSGGTGAVSVGALASTDGTNTTSVGSSSVATGTSASAFGALAIANGSTTTANGYNAQATGTQSTTIGGSSSASGTRSLAAGHTAVASGVDSTALGRGAQATHTSSVALGSGTVTSGANEVAMGARFIELSEVASLSNGAADTARIAARDDGAGNTILSARFSTGVEYRFALTLRATATLDFPSIASGATATLTVSLSGVNVGDDIRVVSPMAILTNDDLTVRGYVSSINVVTVKIKNTGSAAIDPASGDFKIITTRNA